MLLFLKHSTSTQGRSVCQDDFKQIQLSLHTFSPHLPVYSSIVSRPFFLLPPHHSALTAAMSWLFLDWFVPLYLLVSVLVLAGFGACLYFLEPGLQDAHKWSNKTIRHHPLVASVNCRDDDCNALIWSRGRQEAATPLDRGAARTLEGWGTNTFKGGQVKRGDTGSENAIPILSFQFFYGLETLGGNGSSNEFLSQCTEKRREGEKDECEWRKQCPLESCLKPSVNVMPSYTHAKFYIHFVIWQSHTYSPVYL